MMPQKTRVVGLDVAKNKVDACIRSASLRLSRPSTPEGEVQLVAWLRANRVGLAVMEASGGYERGWAEALRAAGVAVRIVDPKRIRCFAKAAGRLAKTDPIDAESIAGSPRPSLTPTPKSTIPRAMRSIGWSRPGRP
jgi:transposase